jgi:hypothetical protein
METPAQVYDFAAYRFEAAPDPADPRYLRVLVFKDGQPFTDLHGAQMSKAFALSATPARIEQFCRRFATDDAYRTGLLLKHAFACC